MTDEVALEVAQPHDAPLLANLIELYVHDLSDVFPVELGPDGRFGYDRLPRYWMEPELRFPFLIRAGDRIAGFVLATRGSPATNGGDDLDVAEFFVLRSHRRSQVGRRAAFLLWDRLPGHWIVRVSLGNRRALSFWQPTIRAYTGGAMIETRRPGTPHPWTVFEFNAPGGAGR